MYLFLVAYYLSILTFYIGVLIYALPIPVTGLKRWGPRLITDSFYVMALLFSVTSIVRFADLIQHILGGDWNFFLSYIKASMFVRSNLLLFFSIIRDTIGGLKILPGLSKLFSVVINAIYFSLNATLILYVIATLIKISFWTLVLLGITLMAIPFRVARNAGAFLIAFSLVFYTALPLYTQFVQLLFVSEPRQFAPIILQGNIVNMHGQPLAYGYIELKYDDEYIGPLPVNAWGYMIPITSDMLSKNITLYFDICGHRFFTNVSNVPVRSLCGFNNHSVFICRVNLMVYGLIDYREGIALHVIPFPENVEVLTFNSTVIRLLINTTTPIDFYISISKGYDIKSIKIDETEIYDIRKFYKYSWKWYDVEGNTYALNLPEGSHEITISMNKNDKPIEPSEYYIFNAQVRLMELNNTQSIVDELARIMYIDVIAASLYISLLLSISYGLARAIGGASRLRLIP
ncbi:MAG: hypothetical protein JHC33_04115 [Ignisphaera sp.]|nr:hypothetical protein [Ignisphaera sp.]